MYKLIIYSTLLAVLFSCSNSTQKIENKEVENIMFSFFSLRENLILVAPSQEQSVVNDLKGYFIVADSANNVIDNIINYKRKHEAVEYGKVYFHKASIISTKIDDKTLISGSNTIDFDVIVHYKQQVSEQKTPNDREDAHSEGYRIYHIKMIRTDDNKCKIVSAKLSLNPIANDY